MDRKLYAKVSAAHAGCCVKDFLRKTWSLSASLLIALKQWEDGITVNGNRVFASHRLAEGDLVCISVGDHGADSDFVATEMPLDILYEDSDLILLNKPPFLPVHPSKGHSEDTLANGLTAYFHKKGETFVSRCVLRLDANTSGAVLFAKNAYAHDQLRRALSEGTVRKEYHALVHGRPPLRGRIDAPIYRPQEATLKRIVDPRGKGARTEYETEKTDGSLSLLRVIPLTGRTHQIRLHLAHAGFPLVSDFLYGEEHDGVLTRHGLHCSGLSFLHPVTGKQLRIKAPLWEDLQRASASLLPAERYRSLNRHLRETYGEKLVKVPLNGGFSCPNREGGKAGCAFCSAGGSGEFSASPRFSVKEQLRRGKELLASKWSGYRYIAYFQAYTNTYAPVPVLRRWFCEALSDPDVAILSVATRPDCLSEEVLDLLSELNREKPVWVELGLQTSWDETAEAFGRGYPRSRYEEAVANLRSRGLPVITHLIFGLPGETEEQMLESVRYVSSYTDGVKIQMLQVLKGSSWGEAYEKSPFPLLSEEEYVSLVVRALALLPPHVTVHRLTGDPPADLLIAPKWTANKKKVLARIASVLSEKNVEQGCDL